MIFKQLYLTYGWHRTRDTIVDQSEFESNNKGVLHTPQIYLTYRLDPNRHCYCRSEWIWKL